MRTVRVTQLIEVPEGATHYEGSLADNYTWWKAVASPAQGARGWAVYKSGEWDLQTSAQPQYLHRIPTEVVYGP